MTREGKGVCVCVCLGEREREREREKVSVLLHANILCVVTVVGRSHTSKNHVTEDDNNEKTENDLKKKKKKKNLMSIMTRMATPSWTTIKNDNGDRRI